MNYLNRMLLASIAVLAISYKVSTSLVSVENTDENSGSYKNELNYDDSTGSMTSWEHEQSNQDFASLDSDQQAVGFLGSLDKPEISDSSGQSVQQGPFAMKVEYHSDLMPEQIKIEEWSDDGLDFVDEPEFNPLHNQSYWKHPDAGDESTIIQDNDSLMLYEPQLGSYVQKKEQLKALLKKLIKHYQAGNLSDQAMDQKERELFQVFEDDVRQSNLLDDATHDDIKNLKNEFSRNKNRITLENLLRQEDMLQSDSIFAQEGYGE